VLALQTCTEERDLIGEGLAIKNQKYFFGCSLSAQRRRMRMALHRLKLAEKWEREGFKVKPKLKSLDWQLKRGFKARRKKKLVLKTDGVKDGHGKELDSGGDQAPRRFEAQLGSESRSENPGCEIGGGGTQRRQDRPPC